MNEAIDKMIQDGLHALEEKYGAGKHRIEFQSDGKFHLTIDRGNYYGKRIYTPTMLEELIAGNDDGNLPPMDELKEYVTRWLWEGEGRASGGMAWPREHVHDAALMIRDYLKKRL